MQILSHICNVFFFFFPIVSLIEIEWFPNNDNRSIFLQDKNWEWAMYLLYLPIDVT